MFERTTQGAVDVVAGECPLNAEHVEEAAGVLKDCSTNGQPQVVFDLTAVPLVDSEGLELLLNFKEEYQQLGGALKLAAPNPLCADILEITGLGADFEVFGEVLSAVGSFVR